jgi:glycosyltransferase involved in cell wall biosynthesis
MIARLSDFQPKDSAGLIGPPKKAISVLHVVENLNNQAVESWLLRVLAAAVEEYPHVHWTFFCVLGKTGRLDEVAHALGAEVIHSRYEFGDKLHFLSSLRKVMKQGRYDILHCHHDIMSAPYLLASVGLPIRKRIVHIHNTSVSLPTPSRTKAGLAREPMRQVCLRMADQIVGISSEALRSLIGNRQRDPKRHTVVHYAVDTARFAQARLDVTAFRESLGINPAARILLFVGRIVEYKNPCFVVKILKHLVEMHSNVVAVFAGIGNRASDLQEMAQREALAARVTLLGFREDVPELMLASDVLIWPSLEEPKEGLGLGIVEAQVAGLPILMSRSVPQEAIVVPELVKVLPLRAGAQAWADAVIEILKRPQLSRGESRTKVESSSFSMEAGVGNIMALYESVGSRSSEPGALHK